MGRRKKERRPDLSGQDGPLTQNPFAQLAGAREQLPAAPQDAALPASSASGPPADPSAVESTDSAVEPPARAVLRYERKGRGGKEVTLIEQLGLAAPQLERWLAQIKRELGCGGSRDGEVLVLQGDQRGRLGELLRRMGVRRVRGGGDG